MRARRGRLRVQFSFFGTFTWQTGQLHMPADGTPQKKRPAKRASWANVAV